MTNKEVRQRILFVINPISGVRRKGLDDFQELLREYLDEGIYDADVRVTSSPGHASEITEEGLEEGVRYFVAVGGDGTINEVASKLTGTDAVLGIIPAGSGNGLAHHLGISVKLKEAIELINSQKIKRIDTCKADDVFFVSIAGIGFDAKVARQFAKTRTRGFKTYARIVLKEYAAYKPGKYTLILDGKEQKVKAFFISFANSSQFGYNTRIAPAASIVDGKIDVCIVEKPPVKAFPGIAHMMFRQRIDRSKYIEIYQAANIIVKRKKGKTVNIDGEPVKMGKQVHFSIRPASLNVIVP